MSTLRETGHRSLRRIAGGLAATALLGMAPFGALPASANETFDVDVRFDPRGTVDPRTGDVTLSGTLTCPAGAEFADVLAEVSQQVGRVFITGFGAEGMEACEGDVPFELQFDEQGIFKPGRATIRAQASACNPEFQCAFKQVTTTVILRTAAQRSM